ncbi:hypothetical protein [Nevskia sp.]|uniref:hypothetical protein n=1 Tax=Nevskia sp. TaxID=1929292 RepID=UPI0025D41C57|nr:hypothetical protein [Nevskia sp.]
MSLQPLLDAAKVAVIDIQTFQEMNPGHYSSGLVLLQEEMAAYDQLAGVSVKISTEDAEALRKALRKAMLAERGGGCCIQLIESTPAIPGNEVYQYRKQGCANWYDGHPDLDDGGGPYESRTLYTAPPWPEARIHNQDPVSVEDMDAFRKYWNAFVAAATKTTAQGTPS